MKKLLLFISIMLLFVGCTTTQYLVTLNGVDVPDNVKKQYGTSQIVTFENKNVQGKTVTNYSYEDSLMKIVWLIDSKQLNFALTNKTSHSIKIIWDEAVYINVDNSSHRVMHSGVKYIDRMESQPPTIIIKNVTLSDMILPIDNVEFNSSLGWMVYPLLNGSVDPSVYVGKSIKVLLPIQIENVTNEYLFIFNVKGTITTT